MVIYYHIDHFELCAFLFSDKPVLSFTPSDPVDGASVNAACSSNATVTLDYIFNGTTQTDNEVFTLANTAFDSADGNYSCSVSYGGRQFTSDDVSLISKYLNVRCLKR